MALSQVCDYITLEGTPCIIQQFSISKVSSQGHVIWDGSQTEVSFNFRNMKSIKI